MKFNLIKKLLLLLIIMICFSGQVVFANEEFKIEESIENVELRDIIEQSASVLKDGKIFIIGGYNWSNTIKSTFIYDPEVKQWSSGPELPNSLAEPMQLTLNDGRVLIVGGCRMIGSNATTINEVYIIDPKTGAFEKRADCPKIVYRGELIQQDNKVYLFGGRTSSYNGNKIYFHIYEYDILTDTWTSRGDLSNEIIHATYGENKEIVKMKNGKLLALDIYKADTLYGFSTYIMDLNNNTCVRGPDLPEKNEYGSLLALENGDIVYIGGIADVDDDFWNEKLFSKKIVYKYNQEENKWEEYLKLPFQPKSRNKQLSYGNKIILWDGEKWDLNDSGEMEKKSDINNVIIISPSFAPKISIDNSDENRIYKNNETLTIKGEVSDSDNDTVTVKASIGGVEKTTTVDNTALSKEWILQWGTNEITEGIYKDIVFLAIN